MRQTYQERAGREKRLAAWQGAILGPLLLLGTLFALYWMLMPVAAVVIGIGEALGG